MVAWFLEYRSRVPDRNLRACKADRSCRRSELASCSQLRRLLETRLKKHGSREHVPILRLEFHFKCGEMR